MAHVAKDYGPKYGLRRRRQDYGTHAEEASATGGDGSHDSLRVSVGGRVIEVTGQDVELTVRPSADRRSRTAAVAPAAGSQAVRDTKANGRTVVGAPGQRRDNWLEKREPESPTPESPAPAPGSYTLAQAIFGERTIDRILAPHVGAMQEVGDDALRANAELHPSPGAHSVLWFGETPAYLVGFELRSDMSKQGDRLVIGRDRSSWPRGVYLMPGLVDPKVSEDGIGVVAVPFTTATGSDQQVGDRDYTALLPGASVEFGYIDVTAAGKWDQPEFVLDTMSLAARLEEIQTIAESAPVVR